MHSSPRRISKASLAQGPVATDTHLVLCQETRGSLSNGGSCTHVVVYLSLLNQQAGGDLHIQLPQHGISSAFTAKLTAFYIRLFQSTPG